MIRAGVARLDITPPVGAFMSGFGARNAPASATHDPLSVRAIALNDTAMVVADVIGMCAQMCARIRARCILPDQNVIVAALHTHGGPISMSERLGVDADQDYLDKLEDACVQVIDDAVLAQKEASISVGAGEDPDIARNRRVENGPVDSSLPVMKIRDKSGKIIAIMLAYACHPVVLGADNRQWTADYPHFVRAALERAHPGAMALFITGCAGDANHGHSAYESLSLASDNRRSFTKAREVGEQIAKMALLAPETEISGDIKAHNKIVSLEFERREADAPKVLMDRWIREKNSAKNNANDARRALLDHWIRWAQEIAPQPVRPIKARVTILEWAGVSIIGLPGEIFAQTGLDIRTAYKKDMPLFIAGFAEDNPGYIPARSAYLTGGYEVDEAHRFYGQPATFAPGSAETLAACAISLLE